MHFTQVLISLSVLIACGPVGYGDITAHQQPSTATEESEQCSTCEFRQHSKLMRLDPSQRPGHLITPPTIHYQCFPQDTVQ
nr:Mstn protein [Danio rerio]